MSTQIMNIGPVPTDESAAQVGRSDYDEQSLRQCQAFKRMLERLHPVPPDCSAVLVIRSFPHDFGSYREVCVRYDDGDLMATDYAYGLENNTPAQWDATANYELIWLERLSVLNRAVRAGEMSPADVPKAYRAGRLPELPANQSFSELLAAFPF